MGRGGLAIGQIDHRDVMDARSSLVHATEVEPDEVLLRVASRLSRGLSDHRIPRYVPPLELEIGHRNLKIKPTPPPKDADLVGGSEVGGELKAERGTTTSQSFESNMRK